MNSNVLFYQWGIITGVLICALFWMRGDTPPDKADSKPVPNANFKPHVVKQEAS